MNNETKHADAALPTRLADLRGCRNEPHPADHQYPIDPESRRVHHLALMHRLLDVLHTN